MQSLTEKIRPEAEPKTEGITPSVTGVQEQNANIEDKKQLDNVAAKQEFDFKSEHNKQNLGWFGRILGGGDNLTNNIAALVLLMCFVGIFITLYMDNMKLDTAETKKLLFGVIMTTIGFIFGSSKK
jgi:hypothetical protein